MPKKVMIIIKLISMTNIIPNNNLYNDYLLFKYNKEQIKQDNNKYIDDQINNNINSDIKYLRKNNSSLLNSISLTEGNIFSDNNISNDNVNNSNINNNENKQNNNIIINIFSIFPKKIIILLLIII